MASVLEAQNGQIWVGTSGNGIDIIDPKIGVIDGIRVTNNSKLGLKGGNVRALAQSDPNTIWIGTRQAGLYRYKLDSKELKNYNTLTGLADNMVRTMAADEDHVWIGTTYGLDRLNISSDTITHMPSIENKTEPMRSRLEMIVQQKDNTVWMTTDTGLYALSPGGDYLQPVRHDPLRDDSLSAQSLSLISLDQNDSVWVPTQNGVDKLLSWDGKIARFESISDHIEGDSKLLNSNLQFDSKGNAWSNGVVLNIESWQLTKLGQVNGIEVGGVEQTSGHRTRNNILLFGGTSGLLMIDPTKYQSWDFNPSLHITSVKVDNIIKKLKPDELLTLQPGTKGLAIEFSALDFSAPSDNQYAYQLVGYDNKWIETDSDHRVANYTNLDPGQYQLRIKGSNRHGQWSPNEITLPLKQLPAWYQTLWFKALSVLMVVSLVIIIYRLRLRQLNLQKRALKRLVKKRTADILMLSEIGRNLTSSLKFDDVIEQVYGSLNKVLDAHVFLLGIVDDDSNQLQIPFMVEGQQKMESWCLSLNDHARPGVWCVNHQSEVIIQNEVDRQKYISLAKPPSKVGHQMGTVVYQPLVIDEKIIGCLSIQSPDENSYTDKHLDMIRTLSSYTAIAVANSLGYSKLKTSNLKLEQAHSEVAMAHNELEKTYKKLEMQSLTDQLTGAHNRRFLRKFIPLEISDLRRDVFKSIKNDSKNLNVQSVASSQPICGFLLIDADHFKWVNDNYGHEAGDQVLIQLVEVIKATCRETDWVVRWGGEEFIIIARNTLRAELHRLAERIRHNVEAHSFDLGNGRNLHRTCSIGVAAFPFVLSHFDLLTWEQTINIADRAMYTSKINGRNAWVSLFDKNVTSFDSFYRQVNEHLPDLVDRRIIGCDSSLTTENIKFN